MEMRIILLVCTVLCSTVFFKYVLADPQTLKACNESANSIDDVEKVEFNGGKYKDNMYNIKAKDLYYIIWTFTPNKDTTIKGNSVELKCESGEIKGITKVGYVKQGKSIKSNKLEKDKKYSVLFESKWDKTPTKGDTCDMKASITLDDVENAYCIEDKLQFI